MKLIQPITVVDATLISSNVPEADYPVYSVSATYALNAYVIVTTGIHKVYQSLVASNIGNAVTDATKWLDCGSTNRWKLHDQSVQSQTINTGSITNSYAITGQCNSIGFVNIDAASITVRMVDGVDGVVYDKTINMVSTSGVIDWYAYFFEPIVRKTDYVLTNLPAYGNATVNVTLMTPLGMAKCGALILGNYKNIGGTQYGAKVGITDYSTKTQDAFGNYNITKRGYRKTGEFSVSVYSGYVDQLQAMLAQYRSTPILYVGSDLYAATMIYGFYKDFSVTISYPTSSLCSLSIEGLT